MTIDKNIKWRENNQKNIVDYINELLNDTDEPSGDGPEETTMPIEETTAAQGGDEDGDGDGSSATTLAATAILFCTFLDLL